MRHFFNVFWKTLLKSMFQFQDSNFQSIFFNSTLKAFRKMVRYFSCPNIVCLRTFFVQRNLPTLVFPTCLCNGPTEFTVSVTSLVFLLISILKG